MTPSTSVTPDPLVRETLSFSRQYAGASGALFYWVDPQRQEMQVYGTQGVPAGFLERYAQEMRPYDPMCVSRMLASGNRIGVLSNERWKQARLPMQHYQSYLSAFGVVDTIDLMLWGDDCAYGGLGLLKTREDPDTLLTPDKLDALQRLLETSFSRHPHVHAFNLHSRLLRSGLSHREKQVALLISQGASNRDIAVDMGVTLATVKTYLVRIFEKLQVDSRTALAARVMQLEKQ